MYGTKPRDLSQVKENICFKTKVSGKSYIPYVSRHIVQNTHRGKFYETLIKKKFKNDFLITRINATRYRETEEASYFSQGCNMSV